MSERRVGERLSEQAREIAEAIVNAPRGPAKVLADAYLAQARQLAEAEGEANFTHG